MNRLSIQPALSSDWPAFVGDVLAYQGWDNSALARRAGVDPSMVGRWLSGENLPTIESIRGVCRAAEVDIREGLIAAGLFTEVELSYVPDPEPDLSKVSDEALAAEGLKRMKRGRRKAALPVVEMVHSTHEQDGTVDMHVVRENGSSARSVDPSSSDG